MRVTVYRLQLFKASEGFIAGQARALPTSSPQLVGRTLFGPPDPSVPFWIPSHLRGWSLGRFILTSSPGPFESAIRTHGSELIHAHFSVDGLYALPLARRMDCPLITTLHGFDVTTSREHFLRSGRPALVRYALLQDHLKSGGAHFICVSRFMYEAALRAGFPENRLSIHYIGIDTDQFKPTSPSYPPRLVHIARLVEKKGTRYVLEAMAHLQRKFPETVVDIIGDGPLRNSLSKQARQLGIEARVRFHGAQPHQTVRTLLAGATALVLPSVTARSGDAEGLGLVLLEASAAGVPVIGTRHGGIPEAVLENESGVLVPERSSMALADAFNAFLANPSLQSRMGQAARKFACERFDIHKQSAKLEAIYRQVCH
jgi:colanic acid/amylovoran biosynthesis glycosyltransferase